MTSLNYSNPDFPVIPLSLVRKCPGNYTCLRDTGPNFFNEFISYDNFLLALLNSLQLVTMDYWESIYNSVSINSFSSIQILKYILSEFVSHQNMIFCLYIRKQKRPYIFILLLFGTIRCLVLSVGAANFPFVNSRRHFNNS